jgi:protein-S-isoprenylcysteine O-methyltransferase Ste14
VIIALLARWRVSLGFLLALAALWLATPTAESLAIGGLIAWCGEALRLWAAGHLEKSTEVTQSGPYRFTRHPLYLGSTLIGIGLAIAAHHLVLGALIVVYLATTLTAAMRSEEAHLRDKFGDAYDAYAEQRAAPIQRSFSWSRALRNREHHAMIGLMTGLLVLALKTGW